MYERDQVQIEVVDWRSAGARLRAVREAVFVQEQGIPADLEWDDGDAEAVHLLASTTDGRPVGVVRLQPDGRIGRMAVLTGWRGRGIGGRLLQGVLGQAVTAGLCSVYLHAQRDAVPFYAARGFVPVGNPFREAGIPHQAMEYRLLAEDGRKT